MLIKLESFASISTSNALSYKQMTRFGILDPQ